MSSDRKNGTDPKDSRDAQEQQARIRAAFEQDGAKARDPGTCEGPHDVKPWPDDPGLKPAALALGDPDELREAADKLGQTSRAIGRADLDESSEFFEKFYRGPAKIRGNAIRSQFERLAAAPKKIFGTTDTRMKIEVAGGDEAKAKADRLEGETPRLENDIVDAEAKLDGAKQDRAAKRQKREEFRDSIVPGPVSPKPDEPEPEPTLAERLGLTGRKLAALLVIEVLVAVLQLDPTIASVIPTTFPFESELIAGSIALGLQLSAFFAGRLIAAIELPQRLVAFFFVGGFGYALVHLVPALNLLREGNADGAVALTWVSMMIATVAAATGWASVLRDAYLRRLATYRKAPEQVEQRNQQHLVLLDSEVAEAEEGVEEAKEHLANTIDALEKHRETIATLRDIVDGTGVRVLKERLTGDEAKADIATEKATADTMIDSEEQHGAWLTTIARLAWFKRRSEAFPEHEADAELAAAAGEVTTDEKPLPLALIAALASLGVGAVVAGATGSLLALTVGTGLAAVLAALALLAPRRGRKTSAAPPVRARRLSTQPLDQDSPMGPWVYLPDHLRPRGGGTAASNGDKVS